MLLLIAAILVVIWLIGFIIHIGGALIHIILLIAIIIAAIHFLS
ncbi:MAG: lmo0937 family membrane protein [Candidatus Saccharimonadales bacterium]